MNRSNTGANLPALRNHNAALVLDLLRAAGGAGISRLELAERTGLTPQAVSKITGRLRDEGTATEAGRRASTGGKPRTVLKLVPSAAHAIGLHLDRDELTAVLVDLAGTLVGARTVPLDLGAEPSSRGGGGGRRGGGADRRAPRARRRRRHARPARPRQRGAAPRHRLPALERLPAARRARRTARPEGLPGQGHQRRRSRPRPARPAPGRAPSRTSTSVRGSARASCSAARCTAAPVPERASSATRRSCSAGRRAAAAGAAASRRCAWRRSPAGTSRRRPASSAWARPTSSGCSTSTRSCSAAARSPPTRTRSYGEWPRSSRSAPGAAAPPRSRSARPAGGPHAVAEGAAQLVLLPVFGRANVAVSQGQARGGHSHGSSAHGALPGAQPTAHVSGLILG